MADLLFLVIYTVAIIIVGYSITFIGGKNHEARNEFEKYWSEDKKIIHNKSRKNKQERIYNGSSHRKWIHHPKRGTKQ